MQMGALCLIVKRRNPSRATGKQVRIQWLLPAEKSVRPVSLKWALLLVMQTISASHWLENTTTAISLMPRSSRARNNIDAFAKSNLLVYLD